MNRLYLIFILILFSVTAGFAQQTDEFEMANKFFEEKDYDSAIRMYQSVINQGVGSAPLYFNLGNAYFKKGDLGYAILNYMRARRLDPSNEDILHNLEFARRFSRVQMEGVELNPISSFMSMIVNPYRLNILAWVSSVCFILFVLIMIFRFGLGYNSSLIRISAILSLIFIMISFGLTTFKYRQDYLTRRGVVVAEEVSVYTGPSILSDVELEAAPGLVIEILDENQEYYNVLFENKRRGWVEKDLIAEL